MLASLAVFSLLQAPTLGAGDLSITNARFTYGIIGPTRTDEKIRPGDSVYLSFDIQGLAVDAAGKASYSIAVDVLDAKNKPLYSQPAKPLQEFLPLGGDSVPAMANIDLRVDSPAGEYTMKVSITDTSNKKSTSLSMKFQVQQKGFDLVRIGITGDPKGEVPVGAFCVGQPFYFHAAVVGFQRAAQGGQQPKVSLMLKVLDENGKPIVAKPFTGLIDKGVPAAETTLPVLFFVPLNRAGKYTIELVATDEIKEATVSKKFPITVIPNK